MPLASAQDDGPTVFVEAPRRTETEGTASLTVLPLGDAVGPATDLATVLDGASGTVVRRLGGLGDFSALRIRGSSLRQVEVCLDGIPLNPDGTDVVDLSELPTSAFSRVELYRGNAPPSLASVAMGGVVNLVTPGGTMDPKAGFAAGSFGTSTMDLAAGPSVPLLGGRLDTLFLADAFHTRGDYAYFDDQGTEFNLGDDRTYTRENNDLARASALGRVRWVGENVELTLLDRWTTSDRGLPGPTQAPAAAARLGMGQNLLAATALAWPAATLRLEGRGWWISRDEALDDPDAELGTAAEASRDASDTIGAQVDARWAPAAWVTTGLTTRWRHDTQQTTDLLNDKLGAVHQRDAGVAAASASFHLWRDRIELSPVVHVEWIGPRIVGDGDAVTTENKQDEGAAASTFVLPRIGAALRPWDWLTLRGNAGMYARPPGFDELYGDGGVVVGNTSLRPESGTAMDVGIRATGSPTPWLTVNVDAAYARNNVTDLIVWVQNSQFTTRAENIGLAYVRTVEGALGLELGDWIESQSNLTWTVSKNLDSDPVYANRALPGLPELELNQATSLRWGERVRLTHTWSYTSASFLDAANVLDTAPRDLHSLALRLSVRPGLPTLEAQVLNLFDIRGAAVDRDPLSAEDDALVVKPLADFAGYPLPGRTFMFGVSWAPLTRSPS